MCANNFLIILKAMRIFITATILNEIAWYLHNLNCMIFLLSQLFSTNFSFWLHAHSTSRYSLRVIWSSLLKYFFLNNCLLINCNVFTMLIMYLNDIMLVITAAIVLSFCVKVMTTLEDKIAALISNRLSLF